VRIPDPLASGYVLRYPYQRGGFNTVGYVSQQEFLGDLETLYATVLRDELGIEREELKVRTSFQLDGPLELTFELRILGLFGHFPYSRLV
jgi:hypothetical protein